MKTKSGKRLAYLLRHDTSYQFKPGGWRETSDLIKNHGFTRAELEEIVKTDSKGRYEFSSPNPNLIRAVQGHSVSVDIGLEEKEPPGELFHGTSSRFMKAITREGLKPMSRQYVHLSGDRETAENVGKRHGGDLVILRIDTGQMNAEGYKFYQAKNGVWLTSEVPWKFCREEG